MPEHTPRTTIRRDEDVAATTVLKSVAAWIRRIPTTLMAVMTIVASVGAAGAWFGAQASSPGQRIQTLDRKMILRDSVYDLRIDSLARGQAAATQERRAIMDRMTRTESGIELLLKIGCRPISDVDLRNDCVSRGIRR